MEKDVIKVTMEVGRQEMAVLFMLAGKVLTEEIWQEYKKVPVVIEEDWKGLLDESTSVQLKVAISAMCVAAMEKKNEKADNRDDIDNF